MLYLLKSEILKCFFFTQFVSIVSQSSRRLRILRDQHQHLLTSTEQFLIIITSGVYSCFVCLSLHGSIKYCIVISLQFFLFDNIASYFHQYFRSTHPVGFPTNTKHKHYPKQILCYFTHYSSWRLSHPATIQTIAFWIPICTNSCCNTIFVWKIHDKYERCKPWFITST